jgi:crotonobetainyl-CoA:carnitine CoA-transferase CaiB-like acyl-CoA transferase
VSEALGDPQLQHLGIIDVLDEPGIGPMPQIRPPALFGGAALPPVARAPYLGEHTDELLGVRHG